MYAKLHESTLTSELSNLLARLDPVVTVSNDSLHTLLEDERIHGTRERDLTAPRPDFYYFKPTSKYLLIEDATGKHRPIMAKEYAHNAKDTAEWPTLFERFLRPSSSKQFSLPVNKIRERAWSLYVQQENYKGEEPPLLKAPRPSTTMFNTPKLPPALPYHNASGNSVVLTSNIASTSTANPSPATFGVPGMLKGRTMTQMNRRVQLLKGNAKSMEFTRQREASLSRSDSLSDYWMGRDAGERDIEAVMPPRSFVSQAQLIRMLLEARGPNTEPPPTVEARVRNREKVDAGLRGREQEVASGYCENCRLRYNDLSMVSDRSPSPFS